MRLYTHSALSSAPSVRLSPHLRRQRIKIIHGFQEITPKDTHESRQAREGSLRVFRLSIVSPRCLRLWRLCSYIRIFFPRNSKRTYRDLYIDSEREEEEEQRRRGWVPPLRGANSSSMAVFHSPLKIARPIRCVGASRLEPKRCMPK